MSEASNSDLDFDDGKKSESLAFQNDFIFTELADKGGESMHNSMWQQMNQN